MKRIAAFSALCALVSPLYASAQTQPYRCTASPCVVTITVNDCTAAGIVLDRDPIYINRSLGAVEIQWKIATADAQFVTNRGIRFKKSPSAGEIEKLRESNKEHAWNDKNTKAAVHPYGVKVKKGTQICPEKDPYVVNEP